MSMGVVYELVNTIIKSTKVQNPRRGDYTMQIHCYMRSCMNTLCHIQRHVHAETLSHYVRVAEKACAYTEKLQQNG